MQTAGEWTNPGRVAWWGRPWREPAKKLREAHVARGALLLMGSFLLSALLGAFQQALFNARFGAGAEASAFYAATRLPNLLYGLVGGRALFSALIPVLVGDERERGPEGVSELTSIVLNALVPAMLLVVLLGELGAPGLVATAIAPGFDDATSQLTAVLTRVMLVQPLILIIASVAIALQNSRNQFALGAISYASHNVALVGGIVLSWLYPPIGVLGPALGFVASGFLQLALVIPGLVGRFEYRFLWRPWDRRLHDVVRSLVPNGLWVGVGYAGAVLDTALASKTSDPAAVAALYNALLLIGLPISLLGKAVGQSGFPALAACAAAGEWRRMRTVTLRTVGTVLLLAVPTAAALIVAGRPLIHVVFEHGRFDSHAADLTDRLLVVYALGLPAYVASEVVARGLIALRDSRTPLLTKTAQLVVRAAATLAILDAVGVVAIPALFAATATLEVLALGAILVARIRHRELAEAV